MNSDKPTITFLVGMPSVGKSTYIKQNGWDNDPNTYIHSSDDIIMEIVDMDPRFDTYDDFFDAGQGLPFNETPFAKEVIPLLNERLSNAIANEMDIVVDMVNANKYARNLSLSKIDPNEYFIRAVVFGHDLWKARDPQFLERIVSGVKARALRENKTVPENVLRERMFPSYEEPTNKEGFD